MAKKGVKNRVVALGSLDCQVLVQGKGGGGDRGRKGAASGRRTRHRRGLQHYPEATAPARLVAKAGPQLAQLLGDVDVLGMAGDDAALAELVVEHGVVVVAMGPLAAPAVEDGVQLPS